MNNVNAMAACKHVQCCEYHHWDKEHSQCRAHVHFREMKTSIVFDEVGTVLGEKKKQA
jgi:hypothetical protein